MPSDLAQPGPRVPKDDPAPLVRAWRIARRVAVTLFVCWHLSFLFITNAKLEAPQVDAQDRGVGHWRARAAALWVDAAKYYEAHAYLDQSWGMFASPVWRTMPFPAGRVELSDGSHIDVLSVNEPPDKTGFVRIGGARLRKLEHHLLTYDLRGTYQEPMQQRYARSYAERWRAQNPGDPRRVVAVAILRRDFTAPNPGERWEAFPEAAVSVVARYGGMEE